MQKRRFREEQIIGILQEVQAGATIREVCRRHGIAETTYYRWRTKYGGMDMSEARRFKQVEEENRRLKRIVASTESARAVSADPHHDIWPDSSNLQKRALIADWRIVAVQGVRGSGATHASTCLRASGAMFRSLWKRRFRTRREVNGQALAGH